MTDDSDHAFPKAKKVIKGVWMAEEAYDALRDQVQSLTRERDAYKRAKEENDERFMLELGDARAEVARLKAERDADTLSNTKTIYQGTHVMEMNAKLSAHLAQAVDALEWYGRGGFDAGCTPVGDRDGLSSAYWQDQGKRARAALKKLKAPTGWEG